MDATPQHPAAEPPADTPVDGAAADTTQRAAPTSGGPTPEPVPMDPPALAQESRSAARRVDAGNTALLIGIIVGLIGSVSVLVGVPIFLLNEEVNRARDDIDAMEAKMDAKFAAQDTKIENRFANQASLIESRFAEQDAKFEARFAEQDAKFDELAKSQAEIDRKLTALIASLGKTDTVEASLAGQIPP